MSIGTNQPPLDILQEIPHHFIACRSLTENYSAGMYEKEAIALLNRLFQTYDYSILCGGSGLYVKAVCEGLDPMPRVGSAMRRSIEEEYSKKGLAWLQAEVAKKDPLFYEKVDAKNPRRLIRALEVLYASGLTFSAIRNNVPKPRAFSTIKIGLYREKDDLQQRIDDRVDSMMKKGLLEEAKALYAWKNCLALQTVGYQELFGYFERTYTLEKAVALIKQNTKKYAKRQLTWFRKDQDITWFLPHQWREATAFIEGL